LLGRPPFAAEVTRWVGRAFEELVEDLVPSPEFWTEWVEQQLYYFLLVDTFRPPAESVRQWSALLAEGRATAPDVLHRIASTASFDLRNPGADTFVTVVMEQLCGITVQDRPRELELGKKAYDGSPARFLGLDAASQSDVVRACAQHADAARHLVRREHARLVGVPPDPHSESAWARRLQRDGRILPELAREWLLSDTYGRRLERVRPKSNRLFVRGLYVDLFDRLPAADEVEPMRLALDGLADPRPLRSVIAKLLIDSGKVPLPREGELADPADWIAGRFRRTLGREPGAEELATFVEVLAQPECRPGTVLYALITSSEYHGF